MRRQLRFSVVFLLAIAAGASMGRRLYSQETSPCQPQQWAKEMDAFELQDAQTAPPEGAVVFVGSSSIRLWDLKKWFPDLQAINRGFGGSQLCDSVHYADLLVLRRRPRAIVLYAGDNDIAGGKSAEQVAGDFRAFVAKVRKALPETPIIYIAIKPSIARWKLAGKMKEANSLIQRQCSQEEGLRYVDVWTPMLGPNGQPRGELFRDDGLHLNDAGYDLWTELVRPLVADFAK